jgi:prepilin-type N-terminal cleavage/methylation domain-containing protein
MIKMPISRYSGFTLVELVVVIVVLGILGTVALGKFEDLSDDTG